MQASHEHVPTKSLNVVSKLSVEVNVMVERPAQPVRCGTRLYPKRHARRRLCAGPRSLLTHAHSAT